VRSNPCTSRGLSSARQRVRPAREHVDLEAALCQEKSCG